MLLRNRLSCPPALACFAVYLDDRVGPVDRVVSTHPSEAAARDEARRRNAEVLAGGADPWRAPLYYVWTGRDELGE